VSPHTFSSVPFLLDHLADLVLGFSLLSVRAATAEAKLPPRDAILDGFTLGH
jgi:hypothetical protein